MKFLSADYIQKSFRVPHFKVFRILLAVSVLSAYLFYLFPAPYVFRFYLENYYLRGLGSYSSLVIPLVIWLGVISASFWMLVSEKMLVAYAVLFFGVGYLNDFSTFAHCSWGDCLPFVFLALVFNEIWRRKNNFKSDAVLGITVRFFECLLGLIYFASVTQRLLDPNWLHGDMLQYFLESPTFSRFPALPWAAMACPLKALTYFSLLAEVLGSFLPFWGRYRRMVIVILLPVHVGLALTSTEVVWQLIVISLLFLSYVDKEPLAWDGFKISRRWIQGLGYGAFGLVAWLYVAALPFDESLSLTNPVVSLARRTTSAVGLASLTDRRLFHTKPVFASCLYIEGSIGTEIISLFQPDLSQCVDGENHFFQDNLLHSGLQASLNFFRPQVKRGHLSRAEINLEEQQVVEETNNVWGFAACKQYSSITQSLSHTAVYLLQVYKDKGSELVKAVPLSYFDCRANQTLPFPLAGSEFGPGIQTKLTNISRRLRAKATP